MTRPNILSCRATPTNRMIEMNYRRMKGEMRAKVMKGTWRGAELLQSNGKRLELLYAANFQQLLQHLIPVLVKVPLGYGTHMTYEAVE